GRETVRDGLHAGGLRLTGALPVSVDRVGDSAAGVGGHAGEGGRVVRRAADRDRRGREARRDRRCRLVHDEVLVGAGALGGLVVLVACIGGLPVVVADRVEGERVGVGGDAVRDVLRTPVLHLLAALAVPEHRVGDGAAGGRRHAGQRGGVVHRAADGDRRGRQRGRDARRLRIHDQVLVGAGA